MESDFFARQAQARRQTAWLRLAFALAVLLVSLAVPVAAIGSLGMRPLRMLRDHPQVALWCAIPVFLYIAGASWWRWRKLRAGGSVVALALGGRLLSEQERDPARKRLVNIVEEMAIAAGIERPQVYLLEKEPGINAFAAGHSPEEAVVAVTAGALRAFDRDELQAVVAHEFSHILNGDMALNTRFVAWLHGLMGITQLARRLLRNAREKRNPRLLVIGIALYVVGSLGQLAGRALQAAASRRREHLADASAVQFTRNPAALQSAFLTMATRSAAARIEASDAPEYAHMFFAGASAGRRLVDLLDGLFATHPPLTERVRALDASVTPERFALLVHEQHRRLARRAEAAAADDAVAMAAGARAGMLIRATAGMAATAAAAATAATDASPAARGVAAHVAGAAAEGAGDAAGDAVDGTGAAAEGAGAAAARAAAASPSGPDPLLNRLSREQQLHIVSLQRRHATTPEAVQALCVALLLDPPEAAARRQAQLAQLAPRLGAARMRHLQDVLPRLDALPPVTRLALLAALRPAIESAAPRELLQQVVRAFARLARGDDPRRYCTTRWLEQVLCMLPPPPASGAAAADRERAATVAAALAPPSAAALESGVPGATGELGRAESAPLVSRAAAIAVLLHAAASWQGGAPRSVALAYRAGLSGILPPRCWVPFAAEPVDVAKLDAAWTELATLSAPARRAVVEAVVRVITAERRIAAAGFDLLRLAMLRLDVPVAALPLNAKLEEAAMPNARRQGGG